MIGEGLKISMKINNSPSFIIWPKYKERFQPSLKDKNKASLEENTRPLTGHRPIMMIRFSPLKMMRNSISKEKDTIPTKLPSSEGDLP